MSDPDVIVLFSGGVGSWVAAKRAAKKHGTDRLRLMFTDTLIEDADLYRFLVEAAANVFGLHLGNAPWPSGDLPEPGDEPGLDRWRQEWADFAAAFVPGLVWIADGRKPWQVMADEKMIASGQRDNCSKVLKRELTKRWLRANTSKADALLVFGIGWEEDWRFDDGKGHGIRPRYAKMGYATWAPNLEKPWLRPDDMAAWLKLEGIALPRLYGWGFAHNNCGGWCVKAGDGAVIHLLVTLPRLYAQHEAEERAFNDARPGEPEAVIYTPYRKEVKGRVPMSMRAIREAYEARAQFNLFDIGGCGCFADGG